MNDSVKAIYEQRMANYKSATDLEKPSKIPISFEVSYWPIEYAGTKTYDILGDKEKMRDAYSKIFDDIYCDGIQGTTIAVALKAVEALGGKTYIMSSDGITIQHVSKCWMEADEYDEAIEDPQSFGINVVGRRKYEKLNGTREDVYAALKEAVIELKKHREGTALINSYLTEEKGILITQKAGLSLPPICLVFDYYRSIKDTLLDMRRNNGKLHALCDALMPSTISPLLEEASKSYPPYLSTAIHSPAFYGPKQFKEFYLPQYKKQIDVVAANKGKVKIRGEGYFAYGMEILADEFPGMFTFMFDQDDPYEHYKSLKGRATIQAGIKNNQLKYLSKDECIELTKKALDTFGPNGGFIFSTDKSILCGNEVKAENLIAVFDYVHKNGVY
ncbi:MAG: hypothetical protein FWG10_14515 [Eubacteriaceae bacterium]|nr:hypothetical protein [Eubacteriaceae bacterium]